MTLPYSSSTSGRSAMDDIRKTIQAFGCSKFAPNAPLHSGSWELDPKWLILSVSISKWLAEKSGVLVDFKFQPRTFANERHKGHRNPIGRYINHQPHAEQGDF